MRARLTTVALMLVATTLMGVGTAAPASATAQCNTVRQTWLPDGNTLAVPASSTAGSNCILGWGSSGNGVYWLQYSLNHCYRAALITDGKYGPATQAAVMRVQALYGLTQDGVYGPITRNRMLWQKMTGVLSPVPNGCVRIAINA